MMKIPEERKALYRDCWDTWGATFQLDMLIEEMSELTKEILKNRRYCGGKNDLNYSLKMQDEIADVRVCIEQVMTILGDMGHKDSSFTYADNVDVSMQSKLRRLRERLADYKKEHGIE